MPRWDIVKFEEIMTAWLQESANRIMNNLNKNENVLKNEWWMHLRKNKYGEF